MRRIRVTGPAQRDVAKILRRSGANFGNQGRNRYRHLIDQAMQDLGDDPAESAYNPSMKFERDIFSTTRNGVVKFRQARLCAYRAI